MDTKNIIEKFKKKLQVLNFYEITSQLTTAPVIADTALKNAFNNPKTEKKRKEFLQTHKHITAFEFEEIAEIENDNLMTLIETLIYIGLLEVKTNV